MKNRDEYVSKMKEQLDRWNAELARLEAEGRKARAELEKRYEKDLQALRERREEALYQLKLVEGASTSAWSDIARGADEAWDRMRAALADARTHFEKR